MPLRPLHRIQTFLAPAFAAILLTVLALPASAVTDKRAVQGASNVLGPAIPEPSSIFLFVAGVAIVGWGVHRRNQKR
ncbi:MAG: PEP-CTERM sorting domain-containing protein [Myxococcales bacterium]|nr:PEP-CTERM sorting domain-containing protein [Myxococcales bacterium]